MSPQTQTPERIRGSSNIPLTEAGLRQVQDIAHQMAQKGGVDKIYSSSLTRAMQTASALSKFTHAPIVHVGDELHPWHLGHLEGQPASEVAPTIETLTTELPDLPIPGRGPESTRDGESFNDFKERTLGFVDPLLTSLRGNPDQRIALVTHYRVQKLLNAWTRMGAEPTHEIDSNEMLLRGGDGTGNVERLAWEPTNGLPQMQPVDLKGPGLLRGGIYVIRHGQTAWNDGGPTSEPQGGQGGENS